MSVTAEGMFELVAATSAGVLLPFHTPALSLVSSVSQTSPTIHQSRQPITGQYVSLTGKQLWNSCADQNQQGKAEAKHEPQIQQDLFIKNNGECKNIRFYRSTICCCTGSVFPTCNRTFSAAEAIAGEGNSGITCYWYD
ncbi:hypothetical protein Pmani_000589 [Petrolisthes manimaculis]|uniref:Uncharacterized protein n=1 Tax=Petrolisthes manimaculis TaxID=1843537 RepID=A0AAE1QM64_9EUCA|nr:hypothetical protein Pmani_000589 [Petrolisthes manimaculis]